MTVDTIVDGELVDLAEDDAIAITGRIRQWVKQCPIEDIKRAYLGRVWLAMGYESWSEWCDSELDGFKLPAVERREVVNELSNAGLSQHAIADVAGVGVGTVNRDLAASPVPDGTPRAVTGQDGKTYPASKPKPRQEIIDSPPAAPTRQTPEQTRIPANEKYAHIEAPAYVVQCGGWTYEYDDDDEAANRFVLAKSWRLPSFADVTVEGYQDVTGAVDWRLTYFEDEYSSSEARELAGILLEAADEFDRRTTGQEQSSNERPGANEYSRAIQGITWRLSQGDDEELTDRELAETLGAAQYLYELLRGESILRQSDPDRRTA